MNAEWQSKEQELIAAEQTAIEQEEDRQAAEADTGSAKNSGKKIERAITNTFDKFLIPAHAADQVYWNSVIGQGLDDIKDPMNEYYKTLSTSDEKTKWLDSFRKKSTNKEIIDALKGVLDALP